MGWLKLHRDLKDKPIWKRSTPEQKTILITLLMMVNYEPNQWEWKGAKYNVKPGQMITSISSIVKAAGDGISTQNVRSGLRRFEKLQFLTKEVTKQSDGGTLITIVNWEQYQDQDNKAPNKEVTKRQQRGNKEVTTIKEIKKEKNDKKEERNLHTLQKFITENCPNISKLKTQLTFENSEKLIENFSLELIYDKIDNMENLKDLTKKYNSVYLTLNNWCKNGNFKQHGSEKVNDYHVKYPHLFNEDGTAKKL